MELGKDKGDVHDLDYLSQCYRCVGELRWELSRPREAREVFEKQLAILKELAQRTRKTADRWSLAECYRRIGVLSRILKEPQPALDAQLEGAKMARELVARDESPRATRGLLAYLTGVADARADLGQKDTALATADELANLAKSVADHPDATAEDRRVAAEHFHHVGILRLRLGELRPAREAIETSQRIWTALPRDVPQRRGALAQTYGNLAFLALLDRRPEDAIELSLRGIEADPKMTWIKTNLANGYLLINQFDKARPIYEDNAASRLESGTFAESVLEDFARLRERGITHPDMAKVELLLKNKVNRTEK